jgi:hypothetical protein
VSPYQQTCSARRVRYRTCPSKSEQGEHGSPALGRRAAGRGSRPGFPY